MMSDVEERERFARKERFARIKQQVAMIRAQRAKKRGGFDGKRKENTSGAGAKISAQAEPQSNILLSAYQAYEEAVMQRVLKAAMNPK